MGNSPLEMLRNDRAIHKIKPTEIQLLDAQGSVLFDEKYLHIRTAQRWKLNRNASGEAEMSVHLVDVFDAPGDLVIDPPIIFEGEGFYHGGDIYDAYLDQEYYDYSSGTDSYLYLKNQTNKEIRILIGVAHATTELAGKNILSANLYLYNDIYGGTASTVKARVYKQTRDWYMSTVRWENDGFNGQGSAWSGGEYTTDFHSDEQTLNSSAGWKTFDISQSFKSHYSTYSYDTGDKGFLVKLTNTADCYWRFPSTENTNNLSLRPYVEVECAAAQFGADIGGDYHSTLTVLQRVNDAKSDIFDVYRYFAGNEGNAAAVQSFVQSVGSNAKLVLVFPINGTSNYATTTDYVNKLSSYLTPISSYMGSTVVGVQFGNEEESSWGSNPYPPHTLWYGNQANGRLYADYLIAGRNYVKQNWPSVEILSGSINHAESLKWPVGETVNPFGSSGEFLKGFILECQEQGNYTNDLLPGTMTIHHYHGNNNPENSEYTDPKEYTEFKERLHEFYNVCNDLGYIPNFAITEYGFAPTAYNQYAPNTNASQISQAVYYTRFSLMQATSGNNTGSLLKGIGWEYNFYFQHPQNPDDTAFHAPGTGYGADRKIRGIAQNLFSSAIGLNDPEMIIVTPVNTTNFSGNVFKGWCAWKNVNTSSAATDEVWAAVWLYNRSIDFNSISETTGSFTIDGDYSGWSYNIKQFNMTNTPATFDNKSVSPAPTITLSSGKTTMQFTSNTLSHNPVFIRFYR